MSWRPYKTIGYVDIAGHPKYNNMSVCVIIRSIYHCILQRDYIYKLLVKLQHIKKKNNKKQNGENMYKQRNSNIPQMRTKSYKLNILSAW